MGRLGLVGLVTHVWFTLPTIYCPYHTLSFLVEPTNHLCSVVPYHIPIVPDPTLSYIYPNIITIPYTTIPYWNLTEMTPRPNQLRAETTHLRLTPKFGRNNPGRNDPGLILRITIILVQTNRSASWFLIPLLRRFFPLYWTDEKTDKWSCWRAVIDCSLPTDWWIWWKITYRLLARYARPPPSWGIWQTYPIFKINHCRIECKMFALCIWWPKCVTACYICYPRWNR